MLLYGYEVLQLKSMNVEYSVLSYLEVLWVKCEELGDVVSSCFDEKYEDITLKLRKGIPNKISGLLGKKYNTVRHSAVFTKYDDACIYSRREGNSSFVIKLMENLYIVNTTKKNRTNKRVFNNENSYCQQSKIPTKPIDRNIV